MVLRLLLPCLIICWANAQQAPPRIDEEMTVRRQVVDVRVIDVHGRPILGLTPANFKLTHNGQRLEVISCEWISQEEGQVTNEANPYPGRLFAIFFQVELEAQRVRGLQGKIDRAMIVLEDLHPNDRIAVLSFDSHLRLYSDFCNNPRQLASALRRALRREKPKLRPSRPFPSLRGLIDPAEAAAADTPEKALATLARGLAHFQGPKTVLYMGFGPVDISRGNFQLREDYPRAVKALNDAEVTVMGLDFAPMDYNTLYLSIRQLAEDTGGTFVKTLNFPRVASAKIHNSMSGYYLLSHEAPEKFDANERYKLRLVGSRGRILAKRPYNAWGQRMTGVDE